METLQPRLNLLSHMEVYNGYPLSLVVALVLHFVILAGMVYSGITRPPPNPEIVQPSIRAFTIDENPQIRNEEIQRRRVAEQQERERQTELDRQAELERQRQAEAEAARSAEQERQAAEEQRQAEQLRQRQAEQESQQERERQAEIQRQAELERQREAEQRARELEAQRQLASEQERQRREAEAAASAEVARTEQEMVMAYTGIIHDLVQQNWSRPPSARNGMTVVFRIQMAPTGDILDVQLVQSSGDYAFDRAAETAIYRVGRFQELQGMPINMFNANFRSLLLTFRPEDLLN